MNLLIHSPHSQTERLVTENRTLEEENRDRRLLQPERLELQSTHKYKNRVVLCSIMNQIFLEIFFALSGVKNLEAEISLTKAPCWGARDWRVGRHDQLAEMLLVVPSKAPIYAKSCVTEKWPAFIEQQKCPCAETTRDRHPYISTPDNLPSCHAWFQDQSYFVLFSRLISLIFFVFPGCSREEHDVLSSASLLVELLCLIITSACQAKPSCVIFPLQEDGCHKLLQKYRHHCFFRG